MLGDNKRICSSELQRWLIISGNGDFAVSVSVEMNRFASRVDFSVFNFETKEKHQCTETKTFTSDEKKYFSKYSKGELSYRSKYCVLDVAPDSNGMKIFCNFSRCFFHTECEASISLSNDKNGAQGSCGLLCLKAEGAVKIKGRTYDFSSDKDICVYECFNKKLSRRSLLKQVGCGVADSKAFCYRLDNFDNPENIFIFNGECLKPGKIEFISPEGSFMNEWSASDEKNRLNLIFKPFFNDHTESRLPFPEKAEKLFGELSGTVASDNGEKIRIENSFCYHEIIHS